VFMTTRKVYKRLCDFMWTFLAASLEELITRDLPGRPMRTSVQNLNLFSRRRSGLPANLTIHYSLLDYFVKGVSEL
jgi:hypothetical protein